MKLSNRAIDDPPDGPRLWGFDGELVGNETRIQGCLPFFRVAQDERVFAARTASWSMVPLDHVTVFGSSEEAERFGTRLELQEDIAVSPGSLVVLYGPAFIRSLHLADAEVADGIALANLPETPSGFRVAMLSVEDFQAVAQALSSLAKIVFDQEIRGSRGEEMSERAGGALTVLRNTGFTPPHDQMIRTLLAERIRLDPDAYRKSLKLGALRLEITVEALEADVERHLRFLLAAPQAAAEAASLTSLSDSVRLAGLARSVRPDSTPPRPRRTSSAAEDADTTGLLARIAAGDSEAFAQFYDRHAPAVLGLLERVLGRSAEADPETILQGVFLQVWRTAHRYQPGHSTPRGWLLMLAHSRALDHLRSTEARRRLEADGSTENSYHAHLSHLSKTKGDRALAIRAIERLSPKKRRGIITLAGEVLDDLDSSFKAVRQGIEQNADSEHPGTKAPVR